jgi:hypothetical protein
MTLARTHRDAYRVFSEEEFTAIAGPIDFSARAAAPPVSAATEPLPGAVPLQGPRRLRPSARSQRRIVVTVLLGGAGAAIALAATAALNAAGAPHATLAAELRLRPPLRAVGSHRVDSSVRAHASADAAVALGPRRHTVLAQTVAASSRVTQRARPLSTRAAASSRRAAGLEATATAEAAAAPEGAEPNAASPPHSPPRGEFGFEN